MCCAPLSFHAISGIAEMYASYGDRTFSTDGASRVVERNLTRTCYTRTFFEYLEHKNVGTERRFNTGTVPEPGKKIPIP